MATKIDIEKINCPICGEKMELQFDEWLREEVELTFECTQTDPNKCPIFKMRLFVTYESYK